MIVCEVDVPGDPVAKGRPRFGPSGTYTPAKTVAAEEALAWQLKRACRKPTSEPVAIVLEFRCKTRRRADIDNLIKLVLDAANGIVYDDDQQVIDLTASVIRGCDHPGTFIRVEVDP